jgi:hypothetical protein
MGDIDQTTRVFVRHCRPTSRWTFVGRWTVGVVRSPFAVRQFAVHQFAVRRSPFAVCRSSFAVRRSPFVVRRLSFAVRRSFFVFRSSSFVPSIQSSDTHSHGP